MGKETHGQGTTRRLGEREKFKELLVVTGEKRKLRGVGGEGLGEGFDLQFQVHGLMLGFKGELIHLGNFLH